MLNVWKCTVLVVTCSLLAIDSFACMPGPLIIDADLIIVEGRPHILWEEKKQTDSEEEHKGVGVLKSTKVLANKPRARPPFQFDFHEQRAEGCIWGAAPIEGFLIRAYLRASKEDPKTLVLLSYEHLELGVPDKDRPR